MARLTFLVLIASTQLFVFESTALAQENARSLRTPQKSADLATTSGTSRQTTGKAPSPARLRDSLSAMDFGRYSLQATPPRPKRSVGRRVLGGAIGATAGFFGGGYLGAAIEGDRCNCDDPGLMGALIGAPVGAVAGGILGALFF